MNVSEITTIAPENWDKLFAPSSMLAVITTVSESGIVNATPFGTCTRVCHDPVSIAFTVGSGKDTYKNVLATGQFVVNVPSFDKEHLEKVVALGRPYPADVDELSVTGLTAIPAIMVRPPRVAEFSRHFECDVMWTKEWEDRLMVVGRVVSASAMPDVVSADGRVIWEAARPAHYCGFPYGSSFVAAYQTRQVE